MREARGEPPDLMAFFGDLAFRSIGSVGHASVFTETNDTGPDACNHDWDGIFAMSGRRRSGARPGRGAFRSTT